MSNRFRALTFGIFVMFFCGNYSHASGQQDGRVAWSPELHLSAISDIPNQLRQPVLPDSDLLTLAKGEQSRSIQTCNDYMAAVQAGFYPNTNYAAKRSAEFVSRCFVLRDLQHARPATSGSPNHWSNQSLKELPPLMVVGSREVTNRAEAAGRSGKSWQEFNPALKITELKDDLLIAEDSDYAYSMEIMARGDFNGDGVEDIAVYGTATGKHSSWAHAEYFIFSQTPAGRLVRLTSSRQPYNLKAVSATKTAQH